MSGRGLQGRPRLLPPSYALGASPRGHTAAVIRAAEGFRGNAPVLRGGGQSSGASAITALPKTLRDGKPIVRSVGGIRADRKSE